MFLSDAPRGTFLKSLSMRRRPGGAVRPLAAAEPGNVSAFFPSCPWPRSALSVVRGGSSTIHARGAKRKGLPRLLAGCAATHVAVARRNLEVSTRTSDAVFLDGGHKRTAFIYVRNTADTAPTSTSRRRSSRPSPDADTAS